MTVALPSVRSKTSLVVRRAVAILLGLVLLGRVSPAAAQAEPRRVWITIQGTERGMHYSLFPAGSRERTAHCAEPCTLEVPTGLYRLEVAGPPHSDVRSSSRWLRFEQSSEVRVNPGSASMFRFGWISVATGGGLIGLGLSVLLIAEISSWSACGPADDPRCGHQRPDQTAVWTGRGMLAVGALALPIGLGLAIYHASPAVDVTPTWSPAQAGLGQAPRF